MRSSAGEHLVHTEGVTGSIPVASTIALLSSKAYGEVRFIAVGFIGSSLHVVAYTLRGERLRVISFRKANRREAARYAQARS